MLFFISAAAALTVGYFAVTNLIAGHILVGVILAILALAISPTRLWRR